MKRNLTRSIITAELGEETIYQSLWVTLSGNQTTLYCLGISHQCLEQSSWSWMVSMQPLSKLRWLEALNPADFDGVFRPQAKDDFMGQPG